MTARVSENEIESGLQNRSEATARKRVNKLGYEITGPTLFRAVASLPFCKLCCPSAK